MLDHATVSNVPSNCAARVDEVIEQLLCCGAPSPEMAGCCLALLSSKRQLSSADRKRLAPVQIAGFDPERTFVKRAHPLQMTYTTLTVARCLCKEPQ